VDLDTVKKASAFMMERGKFFMVQNLVWSGNKILNSCEKSLRNKLEEMSIGWPVEYRTGPVYFKVMIHLVINSSDQSLRFLNQRLEKLTLKDFQGENVLTLGSFVRGTKALLENCDALPRDMLSLIGQALQTSSTTTFNNLIEQMMNNHRYGVYPLTLDTLLHRAEQAYSEMISLGKWDGLQTSGKQGSAFVTCYNCKKEGHISKNCPDKQGDNNTSTTRKRKDNRDRVPPKTGELHEKQNDKGDTLHWCGVCKCWTKTHKTAQHRKKTPDSDNQGNVATPPPAPTPPTMEAPSPTATTAPHTGAFAGFAGATSNF
jgi:hypothetical protein